MNPRRRLPIKRGQMSQWPEGSPLSFTFWYFQQDGVLQISDVTVGSAILAPNNDLVALYWSDSNMNRRHLLCLPWHSWDHLGPSQKVPLKLSGRAQRNKQATTGKLKNQLIKPRLADSYGFQTLFYSRNRQRELAHSLNKLPQFGSHLTWLLLPRSWSFPKWKVSSHNPPPESFNCGQGWEDRISFYPHLSEKIETPSRATEAHWPLPGLFSVWGNHLPLFMWLIPAMASLADKSLSLYKGIVASSLLTPHYPQSV